MSGRMSREERLRLRRAERAVDRMNGMDRKVFLAIRVDEQSYSLIAERFDISDVERHFASSLRILMKAMDEKDPWWWKFWPW
ncbi:RNA polymerase sigma-70 factor (ECF subfamily) [Sphingopyxis sp. OAS728]|uniref:RNA polymerase subunit sigma n=1 Tax=Sphingopyxis sp. OAS728 TaxID=2663823 RepID=UPI00178B3CF2|nr:RNA polymerase subunit sigma [Sphingopyxis sp. OAS728]MBE1526412.1 RNA polymerase sigma-70 factor (ECF subfamily) [Sphingopyxis sp. OAS728]